MLLDLVFGSLWYRLIFAIGPLDQAWADPLTNAIATLAGTPHQPAARRGGPPATDGSPDRRS
jgi:hypothetical protein